MILSKIQAQGDHVRTAIPVAIRRALNINAGDVIMWVVTKNGGVTIVRVTAALEAAQRAAVPA